MFVCVRSPCSMHCVYSQSPSGFASLSSCTQTSVRLIQSLNSALTSACCFPKSSQSSQISHFISEEALTSEQESLTDARASGQHSVLMGQDQRLIRFVQTGLECFSQKGEI